MADLARHRDYLGEAWDAARQRPLSRRMAMLVAHLIDAYVDRQFGADPAEDDILDYRLRRVRQSEALGLVLLACDGGASVVTGAVTIPLSDYDSLSVEDFMVSLYNDNTIQRLLLALPDGRRLDFLAVLGAAVAALDVPSA